MPGRTTLKHTVVAALAASALGASPALAAVDRFEPPTSSLPGTTSPRQDLRGEHARDAAGAAGTAVRQDLRGEHARDAAGPAERQDLRGEHARDVARATEPPLPGGRPARPLPADPVPGSSSGGDDDIWVVLGIGLAATGLVAGGAAGAARRHRVRARRVAA
jgi:hypothetical protein